VQETPGGKYTLAKEGVEFSRYMREDGWHIIPIKASDQLVRKPIAASCRHGRAPPWTAAIRCACCM